jgi:hypothetical protein
VPDHDASHAPPHPISGARPAALLAVRITPDDVGKRVTVRHRYDATTLTDVVGLLLSWSAPEPGGVPVLRVERRDGTVTTIPLPDVAAAKVVPDPPAPRPPRSR